MLKTLTKEVFLTKQEKLKNIVLLACNTKKQQQKKPLDQEDLKF